jgi:CubicO group peptidase (beta-lactamase class C family)
MRMQTDSIFWIVSRTKPVTAMAIPMLEEEGQLPVKDPAVRLRYLRASVRWATGARAGRPFSGLSR